MVAYPLAITYVLSERPVVSITSADTLTSTELEPSLTVTVPDTLPVTLLQSTLTSMLAIVLTLPDVLESFIQSALAEAV